MPKTTLLDAITMKPGRSRGDVRRGLFERKDSDGNILEAVEKDGGRHGAGLIRGASLIAVGEALGHDAFIDEETVKQTVELGNAAGNGGAKVRFTHPSMSGDGLGSFLGRATNLEVSDDGQQAIGDVHFSATSRRDGEDRGGYVLDLAEEDPNSFGMSIVFDHDLAAESDFVRDHSESDDDGYQVFTSPAGEANAGNYPHVRLAALHGADFVDEPAANPDGLFHKGPTADILKQAESTIEFVLGLTKEVPDSEATGGLSADRLRGFLSRFLDSRGLALTIRETENEEMSTATETDEGVATDETQTDETATDETNEDSTETEGGDENTDATATDEGDETNDDELSGSIDRSEFKRFVDRFGAEKAATYLAEGVSYEDAIEKELDEVNSKIRNRETDRGEDAPVDEYSDGDKSLDDKRKTADRKAGFNLPIRLNGSANAVARPSEN